VKKVGYKVKRGPTSTDSTIKEMLVSFFKRLVAVFIILAVMVILGYFLFRYFYLQFPVFTIAADDVIAFIKGYYAEHGIWATLGFIGFICIAVWAWGEEAKRKERRKETMNQMMK
jgi:4-hydroxybenzoate polyprenyltransferase